MKLPTYGNWEKVMKVTETEWHEVQVTIYEEKLHEDKVTKYSEFWDELSVAKYTDWWNEKVARDWGNEEKVAK